MIERWHGIWEQAIQANQDFALRLPGGERSFAELLTQHGDDGMVSYELGQAHEFLGDPSSAESDYTRAEERFPLPHWQEVAREARDRARRQKSAVRSPSRDYSFEAISHRIHAVPEIPHRARVCALFSAARIESQPWMSAALFRMALELAVVELLERHSVNYSSDDDLRRWIALLRQVPKATRQVIDGAHKCRILGNQGVHPRWSGAAPDFKDGLIRFVEIVEWVGENRLLSKSRGRE
jgi:hypothetical protein